MLRNALVHYQRIVNSFFDIDERGRIEAIAIDFMQPVGNALMIFGEDSLALGLNRRHILRLYLLIHIFIPCDAILPLCGQGGLAFDESVIIPLGLLQFGTEGFHALVIITLCSGEDAVLL